MEQLNHIIKIPPTVANFIEDTKQRELTLFGSINKISQHKQLKPWFDNHQEEFVKAWMFGYEVKLLSEQQVKLLNDIIEFALQFEFCDYDQYGDLDDETMLANTRYDILKLQDYINIIMGEVKS